MFFCIALASLAVHDFFCLSQYPLWLIRPYSHSSLGRGTNPNMREQKSVNRKGYSENKNSVITRMPRKPGKKSPPPPGEGQGEGLVNSQ